MKYQSAYEVLKDAQSRDIYNKFGTAGLDERGGVSQNLTSMALFYVIWLVVGYLLTMGAPAPLHTRALFAPARAPLAPRAACTPPASRRHPAPS